jgi:hypothetical protein
MNKHRIFDHCMTLGTLFTGFAVGNVLPISDPKTDSIAFVAGGALILLGWVGVTRLDSAPGVEVEPAPVQERRIPNLNDAPKAPNGFMSLRDVNAYQSTVKSVKVKVLDPRIKQWAWAVTYENTSMVQTKWCGKKRPFSKPAYVAFMAEMLRDGYITPIDPNKEKSSYKPKGRLGREYIRDLATGHAYRPFPTLTLDERSTHFLRAQVRKADSAGQGSG